MAETTHIRVTEDAADRLYHLKARKETFAEVVDRLLDQQGVPTTEEIERIEKQQQEA